MSSGAQPLAQKQATLHQAARVTTNNITTQVLIAKSNSSLSSLLTPLSSLLSLGTGGRAAD